MKVPFLDLHGQYQGIKEEIQIALNEILENKQFIQGLAAENFYENFQKVHGHQHTIGCSNGTSAITVLLRTLGIGPGDEVITVTNTFFATVEAICEVGATPVLVDCRADTYGINEALLETVINAKTKAIIPVHLYGNPCDMGALVKIAKKYQLHIIEDCAQSHLASFNGQPVGTFGAGGTFSFYPGKNLGAYGDAGAIITPDKNLANKLAMAVDHGRTSKYEHEFMAGNYRIDGMQAAVLAVKCRYIEKWTEARRKLALKYDQALKPAGFKVIEVLPAAKPVYHLYIVEVANRAEVMNNLKEAQIDTGIHYPIPLHQQSALKKLGLGYGEFPIAEKSSQTILSLPIFPEMNEEQQQYVLDHFFKIAKPIH